MSNKPATQITLKRVRLAFVKVNKPEEYKKGEGNPRYSVTILTEPDSPNVKLVTGAIRAAAAEKWADKAETMLKQLKAQARLCIYDGDTRDYAGFEGMKAINASCGADMPPTLVTPGRKRLDNETQSTIYSGCWANVIINVWAMDNDWGRRVNAELKGIQFLEDDVRLGGATVASIDDFEEIEGHDDSDDSGFNDESTEDGAAWDDDLA